MIPPAWAVAAFALAAGVNTASVALEHRWAWLTRRFGTRAWWIHILLIAPGWGLFIWTAIRMEEPFAWPLPHGLWVLGPPTALGGVALVVAGFVELGPVAALYGASFGRASRRPIHRGVFSRLAHPVYDGFAVSSSAWACGRRTRPTWCSRSLRVSCSTVAKRGWRTWH